MLNARNTDDTRMFSKMKWLSKLQIQGFFSRVSAKRKQSDGKETSSHDDEPDDSEELAQEYASLTDEEMLEKASNALRNFIISCMNSLQPFESFLIKLDLVSLELDGISKCLHISLSILTLKNESLFSNAISQRL